MPIAIPWAEIISGLLMGIAALAAVWFVRRSGRQDQKIDQMEKEHDDLLESKRARIDKRILDRVRNKYRR